MSTMQLKSYSRGLNQYIRIPAGDVHLMGDLQVADEAQGLVLLAHDCGCSRNNPRSRRTAAIFRSMGMGTLICDLLTDDEEMEDESCACYRHNAILLSKRLAEVTRWVLKQSHLKHLPIGIYGICGGGAAAALVASKMQSKIAALVTRGGRMDLAASALSKVKCPTLLLVGDLDTVGLELNRHALKSFSDQTRLVEVHGATHLFGEPGKLDEVANLSADWFHRHLIAAKKH